MGQVRANEYEEVRARGLMIEIDHLKIAADIASGCGEHGLANRIWALCSHKRRQALVWRHVITQLAKPDPDCSVACDCDTVCYLRGE